MSFSPAGQGRGVRENRLFVGGNALVRLEGFSSATGPPGVRAGYSAELESVRAIAALFVFARHIAGRMVGPGAEEGPPGFFYSFAVGGQTGVTLFFVLSAFLLVPPFLEKRPISTRRFLARRFLRLWPLYFGAVLVATAWNAEGLGDFAKGFGYLVYAQSFSGFVTPLEPFSSVWWSLATEVQFYAALVVCAFLGARRFGPQVLGVLLVLYAVAYSIFVMTGFGVENFATSVALRVSLFGRGWSFLLGGLAAGLYVRHGAAWRRALAQLPWLARGGGDGLVLLVLGGMGLLLMKVETIGTWRAEIEWLPWHIPESALWAAFILGVLVLPLRSRSLLVSFPLERLGIISYSFYLWHLPVIVGVASLLGIDPSHPGTTPANVLVPAIALAFAVSWAVSELTYRWIERPLLLRKQHLAR